MKRKNKNITTNQPITIKTKNNWVISKILSEQNLKPVVNIDNFKKNVYRHSTDTRRKAMGIYNFLPADLKIETNANYIQQGALLHDIGKVLISENILNK